MNVWWLLNQWRWSIILFYFPVPSQIQDESAFVVFSQYATSSHFTRMLSPSVCDFSVASLSDLPPRKGTHCLPLLCWSFTLLTFSQLVRVQSAIFTEKSLCPRYGLDNSSLELRDGLSKRHSCLLEAYNLGLFYFVLSKISDLREIQRTPERNPWEFRRLENRAGVCSEGWICDRNYVWLIVPQASGERAFQLRIASMSKARIWKSF